MERRAENKQRRREIRKAALEEERWIANYSLINAKEELKEADRKRMMGERTASGQHGGKGREELVRSLGEALKIKVLSRKRMKPLLERWKDSEARRIEGANQLNGDVLEATEPVDPFFAQDRDLDTIPAPVSVQDTVQHWMLSGVDLTLPSADVVCRGKVDGSK